MDKIGKGHSATVFKALNKIENKFYAAKILTK